MHIYNFFRKKYAWKKFKATWKLSNSNNFTTPAKIFPIELVKIGNNSYGPIDVVYWGADNEKLIIGNFVSIASNVKFILGGEHNYKCLIPYPFLYKFKNVKVEAFTKGPIVVEDEAWIGYGATILSGVKIGKGAIIGAGSVISKNVPPYSIVVGNPQQLLGYRFSDEIIKDLLKINFSKLDENKIINNIDLLYKNVDDQVLCEIKKIIEI